jgi:hypothetical protein
MSSEMAGDPTVAPNEPWHDRPLTAEELKAVHIRLSKMTKAQLVKAYMPPTTAVSG